MTIGDNDNEGRGVFVTGDRMYFTLTSIQDGSSNTMAFAEGVLGSRGNEANIKGGIAIIGARIAVQGHRPVRPIEWLDVKGTGNSFAENQHYYGRNSTDNNRNYYLGRRWGDGRQLYTAVHTILPPNSPSVARGGADDGSGNDAEDWCAPAASSYHPGGVGTIACDASYRFVTNNVDTSSSSTVRKSGITATGLALAFDDLAAAPDANNPQWYIGPSPYGVWGAYGTPSSGDSATF
jgi:hypothetical protein